MELVVDLQQVTVVLRDPDDVSSVVVRVDAPPAASVATLDARHRLADVLAATNVGRLDASGVAYVRIDAIAFHASGQVDDEWTARFEAARGRLGGAPAQPSSEEGDLVAAVVVWSGTPTTDPRAPE